jgi:hypothetical protein
VVANVEERPTGELSRVVFKGWLPAQEAADYMGVSREYVYRMKALYDQNGPGIPGYLLGDSGHLIMFRIRDLDAYVRAHPDLGRRRAAARQSSDSAGEGDASTE